MKKTIIYTLLIVVYLAAVCFFPSCRHSVQESSITILHTNDIHSSLDIAPFLASAVNEIRSNASENSVLFFDAGDIFSGTIYATLFEGEAETWIANFLDYDAMSPGNHEFDNGVEWLAEFTNHLDFPVLCANTEFADNGLMKPAVLPYIIIERQGVAYGVFGLITSETDVLSTPGPEIDFQDETRAAMTAVAALKSKGVNRIIALTHHGWENDLKLAAQVPGIDIIIGGHSHTVPERYPAVINTFDEPTLIVQAGSQGHFLGRLVVRFNKTGVIQNWDGSQLIPLKNDMEADAGVEAQLSIWRQSIDVFKSEIVGNAAVDLVGERELVRSAETNLGNAIADSVLAAGAVMKAEIALVNGGGIRVSIPAGDISLDNVMEVLPFGQLLVTVDITGSQLIEALENGVSQVETLAGRFPQVAGFRYSWNPQAPPGHRIISVEIKQADGRYSPLEPDRVYRLATYDYLTGGGDDYRVLTRGSNLQILGVVDYAAFLDYISLHSPLNSQVEARITRIE